MICLFLWQGTPTAVCLEIASLLVNKSGVKAPYVHDGSDTEGVKRQAGSKSQPCTLALF